MLIGADGLSDAGGAGLRAPPKRLLKNLQPYIFVILSEAKNLVFSGS